MKLFSPSVAGFFETEIHAAIPTDAVPVSEADYRSLLAGQATGLAIQAGADGYPILLEPPVTADQVLAGIKSVVQSHLDAAAAAAGYDDIRTAVTYADEPSVPKFQAEGQALRAWRSLVWDRCYQLLDEVQNGTRTPMTADQVIAELPMLQLP